MHSSKRTKLVMVHDFKPSDCEDSFSEAESSDYKYVCLACHLQTLLAVTAQCISLGQVSVAAMATAIGCWTAGLSVRKEKLCLNKRDVLFKLWELFDLAYAHEHEEDTDLPTFWQVIQKVTWPLAPATWQWSKLTARATKACSDRFRETTKHTSKGSVTRKNLASRSSLASGSAHPPTVGGHHHSSKLLLALSTLSWSAYPS